MIDFATWKNKFNDCRKCMKYLYLSVWAQVLRLSTAQHQLQEEQQTQTPWCESLLPVKIKYKINLFLDKI